MPALAKVLVISETGDVALATIKLEELVNSRPKLIAIVGKNCRLLEDICDDFRDRFEDGLTIGTTSHPDESVEEVAEFVEIYDYVELGREFLTVRV